VTYAERMDHSLIGAVEPLSTLDDASDWFITIRPGESVVSFDYIEMEDGRGVLRGSLARVERFVLDHTKNEIVLACCRLSDGAYLLVHPKAVTKVIR
jgi:hypothetical protein